MSVYVRPNRLAQLALALFMCLAASTRRADAQPPVPPTQPTVEQPPTQPVVQQPEAQPEGPFRNVFARPRREGSSSLTFTLAGYGGYDDNVISDTNGLGNDPRAQAGGSGLVGTDAGLQYVKTGHRASFAATLGGSYRYFPSKRSLSTSSFNAGAGVSYQLGHRTRVRLDESFAFEPYYQLGGLFPGFGQTELGATIPSNLDFVVLKRQTVISTTDVSLEQQLSRRSTLTFDGQFFNQTLQNGTTNGQPTAPTTGHSVAQEGDVRGYAAGVHFQRQLTRYMSLHIGDQYRQFTYPGPTQRILKGNNIDVGVDYSRSLAFSRHTSLSFSTGSSIVSFDGRQFGEITGTANLSHLFTKSWQGKVSYQRDLNFVQTLSQPLFSDSASAQLQGIIHKRFLMSISGGYLSGRLGLGRNPNDRATLRTGTGAFSLTYAFTDYLRANFDYSYFTYHFSNDVLLLTGMRPSFDRNSVRGGLSLVLPLIH